MAAAVVVVHELDRFQDAVRNLAFLKLFLTRALNEVPSAIPERQFQLPELDIAADDRERRVPNATPRSLQHPDAVRTPRDSA